MTRVRTTQRVLIPGGNDRVTSPPIYRSNFERLGPWARLQLGQSHFVYRAECYWDEEQDTVAVYREAAVRLGLASGPGQGPGSDPDQDNNKPEGDQLWIELDSSI